MVPLSDGVSSSRTFDSHLRGNLCIAAGGWDFKAHLELDAMGLAIAFFFIFKIIINR